MMSELIWLIPIAFVVGALIILWVEARHRRDYGGRDPGGNGQARVQTVDQMTALDALKVGLAQCAALGQILKRFFPYHIRRSAKREGLQARATLLVHDVNPRGIRDSLAECLV